MSKTDSFWEWAESELEAFGLSWYRVEKMSGLANATISKRARERLPPTPVTCQAIARAFQRSKEEVFRIAGILPSQAFQDDKQAQQLLFLFDNLTPDDKERILIMIHGLVTARQKKGTGK